MFTRNWPGGGRIHCCVTGKPSKVRRKSSNSPPRPKRLVKTQGIEWYLRQKDASAQRNFIGSDASETDSKLVKIRLGIRIYQAFVLSIVRSPVLES